MDETGQAYVYTGDDPVNRTDPMGLASILEIGGLSTFSFSAVSPCYVSHTSRSSYDDTTNEVDVNDRLVSATAARYESGNTSFQSKCCTSMDRRPGENSEQQQSEAAAQVWSLSCVTQVAQSERRGRRTGSGGIYILWRAMAERLPTAESTSGAPGSRPCSIYDAVWSTGVCRRCRAAN